MKVEHVLSRARVEWFNGLDGKCHVVSKNKREPLTDAEKAVILKLWKEDSEPEKVVFE